MYGSQKLVSRDVTLNSPQLVKTASELGGMISHVLKEGLEGLVLKGLNTTYEPGKRHWLKVKKDYLQGTCVINIFSCSPLLRIPVFSEYMYKNSNRPYCYCFRTHDCAGNVPTSCLINV